MFQKAKGAQEVLRGEVKGDDVTTRTGEMAELVKYLPYKHEDLS